MAKIHVDKPDVENKQTIDTDSIVEILKQSLYGPYQVSSQKLNVDMLIRKHKILPAEVENQLRTKIKFKVNCENKPLKRIMIDFGPYPLQKEWLIKQKQPPVNQNIKTGVMDSKRMFSPPDIDSDPTLGVKSLVVELEKNEFKLDKQKHLQSKFCKHFRLEDPLTDFVGRLNSSVSHFKQIQSKSERNSFLFLILGLLLTSLLFFLAFKFVNLTTALIVFFVYLAALAFFLSKNSKQATVMQ
jgi:hypothetical protein